MDRDSNGSAPPVAGSDEDKPAAGDQSAGASYNHPDTAAASASQRFRLIPPDGKPPAWHVRHRDTLMTAEAILTVVFFLLTLYFLWLWIFSPPQITYTPDRLGFIQSLAALPPARVNPEWKVAAAPGRWQNIIVHHTAAESGTVDSIDRYHRDVRKWENGLGYHFLIGNGNGMRDGEVAASRRWQEQLNGAHIKEMRGRKNANAFSVGVALVGNFETTIASPRQLSSLRALLRFLMDEYGIPLDGIVGHGQVSVNHTACPGRLFYLDEVLRVL